MRFVNANALVFSLVIPLSSLTGQDADQQFAANASSTSPVEIVPSFIEGKVKSATVYMDHAIVFKQATVPADVDYLSLTLPRAVQPDSVFVDGKNGLTVRTVEVEREPIESSISVAIEELRQREQSILQAIQENEFQSSLQQSLLRTLDQADRWLQYKTNLNESVTASVADMIELQTFASDKLSAIQTKIFELQVESNRLAAEQERVADEMRQLNYRSEARGYLAKLHVQVSENVGQATVRLRYRVDNSGWIPRYEVRCQEGAETAQVDLRAFILQDSGESWDGIQLTLALATPSQTSTSADFLPLRLKTVAASENSKSSLFPDNDEDALYSSLRDDSSADSGEIQREERTLEREAFQNMVESLLVDTNSRSMYRQLSELREPLAHRRSLAGREQSGTDAWYTLDSDVDLPSLASPQWLDLSSMNLPVDVRLDVRPMHSRYAQRTLEIRNTGNTMLLPGLCQVFWNGLFVGQADIMATDSGQQLVFGGGIERQIWARRELISRQTEPRGANQLLTCRYKLVLVNTSSKPLKCRVHDRIPISTKTDSLNIEIGESSHPLSKDATHLRLERPLGYLRWDVVVPNRTERKELLDLEYSYSLEFSQTTELQSLLEERTLAEDVEFLRGGGGMGGMGGGMGGMGGGMGGMGGGTF